ncbi:uncharacterized protein PHALS_00756 [Plasmopara halstedii]|uniref:Uncharacterized protein n=1 Tax=Plasmopara halstedii TaxID=4781 RepID=A0A0P1AS35_PLAHL|nr:uncharacterized protein PHALS_00756 [Plasmopara halstedii]CEG44388.1 hypothetical protein PHALS_00756 [Plasmopara halstedii]|eukprot:XP_024580757.1 hypothetical protein PHALS_00756 [Plasmopara halstedii]
MSEALSKEVEPTVQLFGTQHQRSELGGGMNLLANQIALSNWERHTTVESKDHARGP